MKKFGKYIAFSVIMTICFAIAFTIFVCVIGLLADAILPNWIYNLGKVVGEWTANFKFKLSYLSHPQIVARTALFIEAVLLLEIVLIFPVWLLFKVRKALASRDIEFQGTEQKLENERLKNIISKINNWLPLLKTRLLLYVLVILTISMNYLIVFLFLAVFLYIYYTKKSIAAGHEKKRKNLLHKKEEEAEPEENSEAIAKDQKRELLEIRSQRFLEQYEIHDDFSEEIIEKARIKAVNFFLDEFKGLSEENFRSEIQTEQFKEYFMEKFDSFTEELDSTKEEEPISDETDPEESEDHKDLTDDSDDETAAVSVDAEILDEHGKPIKVIPAEPKFKSYKKDRLFHLYKELAEMSQKLKNSGRVNFEEEIQILTDEGLIEEIDSYSDSKVAEAIAKSEKTLKGMKSTFAQIQKN